MKSLLMLVVAAAPFTVRAADLSGAWHLTGAIANVNIDRVWTIRQSDNKIEGPCKNQMGETALSGEVKGADVTWKYQANYQGSKVSLVFTGALVSDVEIKGTISTAEADGSYAVTGSFDAKRQ